MNTDDFCRYRREYEEEEYESHEGLVDDFRVGINIPDFTQKRTHDHKHEGDIDER